MKSFNFITRVMQSFLISLLCYQTALLASDSTTTQQAAINSQKGETTMHIKVSSAGLSIVYKLNDSPASQSLYAQLPMDIKVEPYAGKEIIFYPAKDLDTRNTPLVKHASRGSLAYYAPWGDVVLFYGNAGAASGLYELGTALSGSEHIEMLKGSVSISKVVE